MDGVKIGIGVLTMGTREINEKIFKRSIGDVFVYVDTERKGVSHGRNKILSHFKDYDHIFLFDDDCYPNREGWETYFIEQCQKHNVHWMGIPVYPEISILHVIGEMLWVNAAIGPFQYFSKKGLETLGGYNEKYVRYGYEDVGVLSRATKAGLTGCFPAPAFPLRGFGYIYSMDINHDNPEVNIDREEKDRLIAENRLTWLEEMRSPQIYYPYE